MPELSLSLSHSVQSEGVAQYAEGRINRNQGAFFRALSIAGFLLGSSVVARGSGGGGKSITGFYAPGFCALTYAES